MTKSQEPLDENRAEFDRDGGAKLYVIFFLLVVPALGVVLVAAIGWAIWTAIFAQ